MADCLKVYINNWTILMKICEEHRQKIDANIKSKVTNLGIKRSAELLDRLLPIATALDKLQSDKATIGNAVGVWKNLEIDIHETFKESSQPHLFRRIKARYEQVITPAHLLSNLVDPKKKAKALSDNEKDATMDYGNTKCPTIIATLMEFLAQSTLFTEFKFRKDVTNAMTPLKWWNSFGSAVNSNSKLFLEQLLTAVAFSAGVERVFSSYGLVQSKLRNRLGTERAAKLVFLFKMFNQ